MNGKYIFDRKLMQKYLGEGEWLQEPDMVEFEHEGIKCLVERKLSREPYAEEEAYFGGHLCGYIFVDKDHPLYGLKIDDIDLDCHGGVTWSEENGDYWHIGFDCAHMGDMVPSMVMLRKKYNIDNIFPIPEKCRHFAIFTPVYRNMEYCIQQCKSVAEQASALAKI